MSQLSYERYARSLSDRELEIEIAQAERAIPDSAMLAALLDEQERRGVVAAR